MEELKEKIIADLLKTGFPLEVYVSNQLNNHQWRVISSSLYVDPDSGVTRELDLNALNIYKENPENVKDAVSLFSHLIIQCKKSDKPWVFFDNGGTNSYWLGYYSLKCGNTKFMSDLCFNGPSLDLTEHRYKNLKLHRSFHVSFNQSDVIYEALLTACKALEHNKGIYAEDTKTAHFFTPIVVLDGTLWSASLDTNYKIEVNPVNRLVAKFDYIFGSEKRARNYKYQLVEIVTKDEFEASLVNIEKDNSVLLKSWVKFLKGS